MPLTEQRIKAIIDDIAAKLLKPKVKKGKEKDEPFYISDTHKQISCLREDIAIHAEYGTSPAKLLSKAAPNETAPEFDYRLSNYKQLTKTTWDKGLSSTYRIWNEQNYKIDFPDQDDTLKEYLTVEYPKYGNFFNYFRDVIHKEKFADPNSVVAVRPKAIPMVYDADGEIMTDADGMPMVDQSKEVEPICMLYTAYQCWFFEEGEYCLLLSDEKSLVDFGNGKELSGYVFDIYDDENIWRVKQIGKKVDYTFQIDLYYKHGWDSMPAWKLKGILCPTQYQTVYHSYFQGAIPYLDFALILASTQFGVINKVAYPTRWYYSEDCGSCSGTGKIGIENPITCETCHGTGKRFTFSWGKDMELPLQSNATGNDIGQLATPPAGFIEVGTEILKFADEKINSLLDKAFTMLNIETASHPSGQPGTATESQIDREEFLSFLIQITNEIFALLGDLVDAMGYMRLQGGYKPVSITKPSEFGIKGSDALTKELTDATAANLPNRYINNLNKEINKQRFPGDKEGQVVYDVVSAIDAFMNMDTPEILSLVTGGLSPKWKAILHTNIDIYIAEQTEANPNFLEGDIYKDIKPILEAMAKADEALTTPNLRTADGLFGLVKNGTSQNTPTPISTPAADNLGKIPLAIQQLALARARADASGDTVTSKAIGDKIAELLQSITP